MSDPGTHAQTALAALARARGLSAELKEALELWLTGAHYEQERTALQRTVLSACTDDPAWSELQDAFRQLLPIGTGGRRGKVAPGPNRVNSVTLRETVYGLHCTMQALGWPNKVVVGYDTRVDSPDFAHLAAKILLALGTEVLLLDAPRPTPQIAFTLRQAGCGAGVVISASHNPPGDNGIKIYGPDGAQVFAKRDNTLATAILEQGPQAPASNAELPREHPSLTRLDLARNDEGYLEQVRAQGLCPDLPLGACGPVVYTALQGVGYPIIAPLLEGRGVELHPVPSQCDAGDGRFSQTTATNPENAKAFDAAIALAQKVQAKVILANDPDADRLGVCLWSEQKNEFEVLAGNEVCALLTWHVCRHARPTASSLVATTLVTSSLVEKIASAAGFTVVPDLLVGFKHHAAYLDHHPEMELAFGCEESLGYIRGNEIRDKDGAIAALLICELLASLASCGKTWEQQLEELWREHGVHVNHTENVWLQGQAGAAAMARVMDSWRKDPPMELGEYRAQSWVDRASPELAGKAGPVRGAPSNLLIGEFCAGDRTLRVVIRPSGTEPKLKLYFLSHAPVEDPAQVRALKARVEQEQQDLLALAKARILACT